MHPKQVIGPCTGLLACAVLLTVIQPPLGWSALAWIALVPFALACAGAQRTAGFLVMTYIVGAAYWSLNLTWLIPCTGPGWLVFSLYLALLWPLMALALRFSLQRNVPMFVACAVVFVGAERLQGVPLGGFFWRQLCHSQFQNIHLIQIADLCGASGVSLLLALTNGLIADLCLGLKRRRLLTLPNSLGCLCTGLALLGALLYGRWRISQTEDLVRPGPLVAAIQSNVPQSVKDSFQASDEIVTDLLKLSEGAARAGAELIAWPETMVQATMDRVVQYLQGQEAAKAQQYDRALRDHVRSRMHLLIGAHGGYFVPLADGSIVQEERYNSAFLYRPDGTQHPDRYDKIHLVLFGETMPFRKRHRWLYRLLMLFSPYDYDHSIDAGSQYTVFSMSRALEAAASGGQAVASPDPYRFATIICYEDTIPYVSRNFVLDDQGHKQIDWLVNISNDGWFVHFDERKGVTPTAELAQHTAACVFRAIENRVAILRSVNSGISCLIDSCGRLRNDYIAASPNWPRFALNRQAMTGWFMDRMPIDKRISFYTQHGQWLDNICAMGLVALLMLALIYRRTRRKARVKDKDATLSLEAKPASS